ncbi:MAG: VIT1/CCC1 transporter family protein [Verrucomicrobiales bacterium]|nr:VIT1/CCC1 transporter family protein [Verrucomicrobiales bacterium]
MSDPSNARATKRVLEPIERISEVLFGLIMVLGFTGSLSAAQAGRSDVRTMLFGAIGCNLAWGLIDAIMYLMGCLAEKGRNLRTLRAIRRAPDAERGRGTVAAALPEGIASVLETAELERIRVHVLERPEPPKNPSLDRTDWLGALGVFLLVFVSTFPVVLPFIFVPDTWRALRLSNLIAIGMLFLTGYFFGKCSELRPVRTGAAMVLIGIAMVGVTMVFGG